MAHEPWDIAMDMRESESARVGAQPAHRIWIAPLGGPDAVEKSADFVAEAFRLSL